MPLAVRKEVARSVRRAYTATAVGMLASITLMARRAAPVKKLSRQASETSALLSAIGNSTWAPARLFPLLQIFDGCLAGNG